MSRFASVVPSLGGTGVRPATTSETMGPPAFLGDLLALAAFSDSGGTLAPSPRGRPQVRGVAVCRRLSPSRRASASLSLRLAAPRFRRRSLNSDGYPRQSLFRSSITRLSHSLSTLRNLPSRSRGRTATQDSLPTGGQPLPEGDRYPARSLMKFQPHLHGVLLIQAFATQATAELASNHRFHDSVLGVQEIVLRRVVLTARRHHGLC
jgi:hypothetical protein